MDNRMRELLEDFQKKMIDNDQVSQGMLGRTEANYPMAVVCLGAHTAETLGEKVQKQILSIWPAYKNVLLFLEAVCEGEELQVKEMGKETVLTLEEIQDRVSGLFEENGYFKNYTRMQVFYIWNTVGSADAEELSEKLAMIRKMETMLAFPNQNPVFCIALDERIGKEAKAAALRNQLADLLESRQLEQMAPCVYLVGNKNSMGSLMPKEDYFGSVFADLMILADGADPYVSSTVVQSGINTVGYATVQKPSEDIAKVSVFSLLKQMSGLKNMKKIASEHLEEEEIANLAERLGIRKNGKFFMIDPYIDAAEKEFPTPEVLNAFPRRSCEDLNLEELTAEEVDEQTFGAWSSYIQTIVSKIEAEIVSGFQRENDFQETFLNYLQENFSRAELIWLSANTEEMESYLQKEYTKHNRQKVIDSLKEEVAVKVSQNETVRGAILDVIRMAGENAREFMAMWNELVTTETMMLKQQDIAPFYEQKVQNYIDMNGERIAKEFQKICSGKELMEFLKKEISGLIKGDKIFKASFEDELIQRLGQKDPATALRTISDQLTGSNVKIWLSSSGSALDAPIQLTLLVKAGTALENTIKASLNSDLYYSYDTRTGESADALNLYQLESMHLRA